MFYFDYVVSPSVRCSVVRVPFETEELRRQLIFLRNGQVVRSDLLPIDIEKPVENELAFEGGRELNWLSCDNRPTLFHRKIPVDPNCAFA